MKFSLVAAVGLMFASTVAGSQRCLNSHTAMKLVNRYASILQHIDSDIGNATVTANVVIANGYTETSDSILSLEQKPLGTTTFSGKDFWIESVLNAPTVSGVQNLKILVSGCHTIIWSWNFARVGTAEHPVKGISIFEVNARHQIKSTQLEFNSIAWGQDTFQLPCGGASAGTEPAATRTTSAGATSTETDAAALEITD